jgi:hypothetical protein
VESRLGERSWEVSGTSGEFVESRERWSWCEVCLSAGSCEVLSAYDKRREGAKELGCNGARKRTGRKVEGNGRSGKEGRKEGSEGALISERKVGGEKEEDGGPRRGSPE